MMDFLTRPCLFCAAILFSALLALVCGRLVAREMARLRPYLAAFLVFTFVAMNYAQKSGTNAPPEGASPPGVAQQQPAEPPRSGGPGHEVTNLCFTAIDVSSNSVALSLAWPTNFLADGCCLDFFAKAGSLTGRWEWVGFRTVGAAETNMTVELVPEDFPGGTNMPSAAFFSVRERSSDASTMRDWDGDGIPDVYELNNGTNPYVPDAASVPRLTVGEGCQFAGIADALLASEPYSVIELSAGEHLLTGWTRMPGHPVMLSGPVGGYAVVRSRSDGVSFMLDRGQTCETLFRNLILVLERTGNFQAGFWIGGNLPWEGVGASPTFENVRIRAPKPGTFYYGWHYYRDDGGTSAVSGCTMNAAGAERAIGVYSYGGPDVSVEGCSFVNFPATNGSYATYHQTSLTNISAECAMPDPGLSWAGYPLDGEYSATEDSDGDGLSDHDEIFVHDTDPWLADSDCDGVPDGVEVDDGTDPRNAASFLRRVVAVVEADDALAGVTNYVAWGVAESGWVTNGLAAFADSSAANGFTVANSNVTVYAKAYRDLNRNGEYDEGADVLLATAIPSSAAPTVRFAFGDVDGDGVSDAQERLDGTDPYDAGSFRLSLTVVFENSDASAAATNYCAWGLDSSWTNCGAAAFAETASYAVDVAVTNGVAYAKCLRDFDADGEYAEGGDILYVQELTKADNGKTVTVAVGDRDADGIPDSKEVEEGTDPRDAKSYCFNLTLVENGVFCTTNFLTAEIKAGAQSVYGPEPATNRTWEAEVGHVVVTNGGQAYAYFWDDANTNGVREAEEPCVTQRLALNGHDNTLTNTLSTLPFDRDRDGILDWWEHLHSDAGLSPTNSADAWLDPDGDGLLNLHEYWADCNPLVYDGTNTAIYAAAHSVDDGITGRDPLLSMPIYVDYKNNVETNSPPIATINTNSWAAGMLHGCFSLWSDDPGFYMNEMNPISPYHVVMASHCGNPLNVDYKFMGLSGTWYTRQLIGKVAIPNTDITIGIVNEALPTNDLRAVYLLPENYPNYLGTLIRLPVVQVNQDKLAIVQEISRTVTSANRYYEFECSRSSNNLRYPFGMGIRLHDSGSPCYLIVGDKPVLLYAIQGYWYELINGVISGAGFNTALFAEEIQAIMNDLSDAKNLPRVGINFFNFSQYEQLSNWR